MLANVNIWVDVLAIIMLAVGVFFWVFQFTGNYITGKFKERLHMKHWPKRTETALPSTKSLHGLNAVSVIALVFSGFYVRFPFFENSYDSMRLAHRFFIFPVVLVLIFRVCYAILKNYEESDYGDTWTRGRLKSALLRVFVKSNSRDLTKYGLIQKTVYVVAFPALLTIVMVSGFSLIWPQIFLGWFAGLFEGLALLKAWAMIIHYITAAALAMFIMVHICLTFVEDYPTFLMFFSPTKQPVLEYKELQQKTG